jgi:glycerol-3-phosphate acyltransferase PlsY
MTTTGACIALFPLAALVLAPIGIGILVIIRYASVASLTVATLYPIVMFFFAVRGDAPWSYFLVSLAVAALLIWVHRPNIERLRTGTEKRFGQRIAR